MLDPKARSAEAMTVQAGLVCLIIEPRVVLGTPDAGCTQRRAVMKLESRLTFGTAEVVFFALLAVSSCTVSNDCQRRSNLPILAFVVGLMAVFNTASAISFHQK